MIRHVAALEDLPRRLLLGRSPAPRRPDRLGRLLGGERLEEQVAVAIDAAGQVEHRPADLAEERQGAAALLDAQAGRLRHLLVGRRGGERIAS